MDFLLELKKTIIISSIMMLICGIMIFVDFDLLPIRIVAYIITGGPLFYVIYRMFRHQYGMADLFFRQGLVREQIDKGQNGWFGKVLRSENYKVLKPDHIVRTTAKVYRLATLTSYGYFFVLVISVSGVLV